MEKCSCRNIPTVSTRRSQTWHRSAPVSLCLGRWLKPHLGLTGVNPGGLSCGNVPAGTLLIWKQQTKFGPGRELEAWRGCCALKLDCGIAEVFRQEHCGKPPDLPRALGNGDCDN